MDEPANHLDVETVDALCDALNAFRGTIIFTAHDRHFVHRVATDVVEVRDRQVTAYQGNYDHYVYRVTQEIAEGHRQTARAARPATHDSDRGQRKARARRFHELSKEIRSIERQIAKHEARKAKFGSQRVASTSTEEKERIDGAIAAIETQIKPLEERWVALHEELGL
jgi:ATP-binding cassette subfamily F protein 3